MSAQNPSKPKLPVSRLKWTGKVSELYRIFFLNIVLSILTLGFYRFWGKARMRRYIASHILLDGKAFEYTGTGKQLLSGSVKTILLVVAFGGVATAAYFIHPILAFLLFWSIFFWIPFFVFMAIRYRLRHLKWKGIRFGLKGSALAYTGLSF